MTIIDIITIVSSIIGIIGGIIGIYAFFMKLKWKVILPKIRLKLKLKKYKRVRNDFEKERKKIREIGRILYKAQERLEYKNFTYTINAKGHGDIIVNDEYNLHLTSSNGSKILVKFLIRKIDQPEVVFHSYGYPEAQRSNDDISLLDKLIRSI